MVPSAFVALDSLPLTASGKVDRLALPDPEGAEARSAAAYVAPRTPVEESVAAIWADVLGLERVGVEDDFFALGGHSLLATQIVAQVRSDFSIELPLHALFTSPTVALLSQQVVELLGQLVGQRHREAPLRARGPFRRGGRAPARSRSAAGDAGDVSSTQERPWSR